MEWIKFSKYNPPPQGLKIVCFKEGDLWVAMRFEFKKESYYIQLIHDGSGAVRTDTPDYWMKLDLPQGYSGLTKAKLLENEEYMTIDELQLKDYDAHQKLVSMYVVPAILKKRVKINGVKEKRGKNI